MKINSDFVLELYDYKGSDAHVEIPEGVQRIGDHCFLGNTTLRSVRISEGVRLIFEEAFGSCPALEEVTLPASLEYCHWDAFSAGGMLRLMRVPAGSWVRQIPEMLGIPVVDMNGRALPPVPVNDADWLYEQHGGEVTVTGRSDVAVGILYPNEDGANVLYVPHTLGGLPVTGIGKDAFKNDNNYWDEFDALYLPDGIRVIGENAFARCWGLKKIRLPGTLENIGDGAFKECLLDDITAKRLKTGFGFDPNSDEDDDDDEGDDDENEDEAEAGCVYGGVLTFRPHGAGMASLDRFRELSKPLLENIGISNQDMEQIYEFLTKKNLIETIKLLNKYVPSGVESRLRWAKELMEALEKLL